LKKSYDCLGFGIAPADILMQIDRYPRAGEKINATDAIVQGGGPIPTAMVTLARLGLKPALITAVGDDLFGRFVIDELNRDGIDTSLVIKKKTRTAIAAGWVEHGSGRRTISLDLGITLPASDIKTSRLPGAKVVHMDGRYLSACLKLARWAKRKGIPVSLDIGSMRNDVSELLPLVDHLVCADVYALGFTGCRSLRKALDVLRVICPGTIVVTAGTRGALGYTDADDVIYRPAFKVKAVDTTGAGDAFHGGYLFGLIKGWSLEKRLEFASAVAALKCGQPGGRTGIPGYRKVRAFIKKDPPRYA